MTALERKEAPMAIANLTLRFLTELAGIAAIGYAGFQVAGPFPVRAVAGIGAAGLFVIAWSVAVAPNTVNGLTQPQKDLIGTAILFVAAAALALAGQPGLASTFAIVVFANTALLFVFGQDARESLRGMTR
ncbi:MAG TPA: YrdB family protein [Candidatus Limnocylindria bacterium]